MRKPGRFYEIEGRSYPSVTTVLGVIAKPALVGWASNAARDTTVRAAREAYSALVQAKQLVSPTSFEAEVRKRLGGKPAHMQASETAMNIGSLLHARIEGEMRRELGQDVAVPELPQEQLDGGKVQPHPVWLAYQSYLTWRREHAVTPLKVELVVYEPEHGYAGTLDCIALIDEVPTLIDWKTSKAVYPEYLLQVAAYSRAFVGPGQPFIPAAIVRLPKEAKDTFEVRQVPSEDQPALFNTFMDALRLWRGLNP